MKVTVSFQLCNTSRIWIVCVCVCVCLSLSAVTHTHTLPLLSHSHLLKMQVGFWGEKIQFPLPTLTSACRCTVTVNTFIKYILIFYLVFSFQLSSFLSYRMATGVLLLLTLCSSFNPLTGQENNMIFKKKKP